MLKRNMRLILGFPFFHQNNANDCGPACLRMIAKFYGKYFSAQHIRLLVDTSIIGTNLKNLAKSAETLGFKSLCVRIEYSTLSKSIDLPCVVHWNQNHFIVVYKFVKDMVIVGDPAHGIIKITEREFLSKWVCLDEDIAKKEGIALLVSPSPLFFKQENDRKRTFSGLTLLYGYVKVYKGLLIQLLVGLLAASLIQLLFPFLTQSVVDIGIQNKNIGFIYLILIAQICLFIGRLGIDLIRGWILLHLSTRINISLISDFFIKLMKLPISYFDTKMTGDILQRINDHKRIEQLLTSSTLSTLFSFFNLIVFSVVLSFYSSQLLLVFFVGTIIYFVWIFAFLKRRKDLDYLYFNRRSQEQSTVIELINGMQEIKLNNAEQQKRWKWEDLQIKLFKINIKSLTLQQVQSSGSFFVNELKNALLTIISAKLVIDGKISLGMMMSVSYIIGQLNSPIQQLIGFVYSVQDASIALERLQLIYTHEEEDSNIVFPAKKFDFCQDIIVKNLKFKYVGTHRTILNDINLMIPHGKVTAIVGPSGGGKTTLLKLILKYYEPIIGQVSIGDINLSLIPSGHWRSQVGVVMQDSFVFNDTIANNVAVGEDYIDEDRLVYVLTMVNMKEFIESLPWNYNTKIGLEGLALSAGQTQRLIIARALYKNPKILLFDEATSYLDSTNEKEIMDHLLNNFQDRTFIIIAHRLSTIRNADQIVVLNNGEIVEVGSHLELVSKKGNYYDLVRNQLE